MSCFKRGDRVEVSEPYASYEDAQKRGGRDVWPGCKGTGRCRPCGRLHDFQRYAGDGRVVHDYCCWQNHEQGCPLVAPPPEHELVRGRCTRCGARKAGEP